MVHLHVRDGERGRESKWTDGPSTGERERHREREKESKWTDGPSTGERERERERERVNGQMAHLQKERKRISNKAIVVLVCFLYYF